MGFSGDGATHGVCAGFCFGSDSPGTVITPMQVSGYGLGCCDLISLRSAGIQVRFHD